MIRFKFYPWRVIGDDHSTSLIFSLSKADSIRLIAVGVGWDTEHPLSLMPKLTSVPIGSIYPGWCFSCMGIFIQYRWLYTLQ